MISTLRETDDADETTQLVSDCANLLNDAAPAATEAALDVRQELREELLGSLLGAADGSALAADDGDATGVYAAPEAALSDQRRIFESPHPVAHHVSPSARLIEHTHAGCGSLARLRALGPASAHTRAVASSLALTASSPPSATLQMGPPCSLKTVRSVADSTPSPAHPHVHSRALAIAPW